MKYLFLRVMLYIGIAQVYFNPLLCMELSRAESERMTQMKEILNENKRIGPIATLIIEKHTKESYYETLLKEAEKHLDIITEEKSTTKSYTWKYSYNPFILKGACPKDTTPLALALITMLQKNFNPDSERNYLNDAFCKKYDIPEGFTQVDFCVSAKEIPSQNMVEYIARFFNKESLLQTISVFNPQPINKKS